jgi:hypothetical protein
MKKLAAEFAIIVAGVLLALAVDEWRQDREELRIANEHLSDISAELRANLCTVERIRARALQKKIESLQTVLQFLNDPGAHVEDPAGLLQAFAVSTSDAKPWLVDNQFQALQNSGHVRLVSKLQPDLELAGTYRGPEVLFSQVDRIQGAYPIVVNELIPAQLQPELSQLAGYARNRDAPPLADEQNLQRAIEGIRARRVELLGLARNEAAVATAKWYALSRIQSNLREALESLAPWDRSTTSIEEDRVACTAPRKS